MADYTIKDIRNIALISHAGSGKTSFAEAIVYNAGASNRFGKVDDGTSVSDYSEDEIERKVSISASILSFKYANKRINIIDAPGYADFIGEMLSSLNAVDSAMLLIDAHDGIRVGTEKTWSMANEMDLARAIFLNKFDKENINFHGVVNAIKERLDKNCVLVNVPIGTGPDFKGVADLLDKSALDALNGEDKQNALKLKNVLIEAIAEANDELLEKYLEGKELTPEEIKLGFKKAVSNKELFPIYCGSATLNIGIKELMASLFDILPSPLDSKLRNAKDPNTNQDKDLKPDGAGNFSGFVFKTVSDPYVGQLTIFRVYTGSIKTDTSFYNSTKRTTERIGHLLSVFGKEQRPVTEAIAGDIVAVAKLKETSTGDSLCIEKDPVVFSPIEFPEPAISFSIKPKTRADEDKISIALHKLVNEDQTFKTKREEQTKELIISGMGDLHLDIMINRLKKRFGVDVEKGTPKVAYKETIKKMTKLQGKYKRQTGGHGQYGDCWLQLDPLERGKGFEFVDKVVGGVIPKNYIPSIQKGVVEAMSKGALAGHQIVDMRVTVYDGSYHEVDSSDMAFKIAGSLALRKGVLEANPVLLEPIMDVDVIVPEEFMGDITGDLNSRRGRIAGMDVQGKYQVIKAKVPIAEMSKYASELKSITGGRGSYSMRFSHYDEVPAKSAQIIIAKYQETKKEEQEG
ncbi:MAG: elongation factor G [Candidatus Omnitrophica bacterium CG22_combo_CG10-13_8_21_14_all_43_16]|nr:MAG: elongation factor G [Candidatus Omnitrophica bacterium CG22_combo_CG10-13_8_21_14_all_43_16]